MDFPEAMRWSLRIEWHVSVFFHSCVTCGATVFLRFQGFAGLWVEELAVFQFLYIPVCLGHED